MRIAPQHLLDLQRQPVHAFAHVGPSNGQPHPHPARNRDHRRASTSRTRSSAAASTSRSTRTRRPPRNLLLDTEPAPPFHAPQYLGNRVRHRSCAIASSSSKPASRILTPPAARRPSPQGYEQGRATGSGGGGAKGGGQGEREPM